MMTEANEAALLPCPRCGCSAYLEMPSENESEMWRAVCNDDCCAADTPADAIAAWNLRPTITQVSQDVEPAAGFSDGIEAAARHHDDLAANAAVRFGELDRYSDCADERAGWRSWKDANDSHRYHAACIRTLRPHAVSQDVPAPAAGVREAALAPHIFLDCDGVLADFDTYAEAYFGMPPREYEKAMGSKRFWAELEAKGDFYRNLPLMPDARDLVAGVAHLNPTILTGCPRGNWAEAQKVAWAHEHFPGVPVITCRSADKRVHAKPGDVLIDDWPQHRHRWVEMGGVFISHFDAASSLATLWAHYPALNPTGAA